MTRERIVFSHEHVIAGVLGLVIGALIAGFTVGTLTALVIGVLAGGAVGEILGLAIAYRRANAQRSPHQA